MLFHLSKKSRLRLGCLLVLIFTMVMVGCSSAPTKKPGTQPKAKPKVQSQTKAPAQVKKQEAKTLTYKANIQPILSSKCVSCHSASGMAAIIPLDTYSHVMSYVKAGKPKDSRLVRSVDGGSMSNKATPEEVKQIKTWVSQGAKE